MWCPCVGVSRAAGRHCSFHLHFRSGYYLHFKSGYHSIATPHSLTSTIYDWNLRVAFYAMADHQNSATENLPIAQPNPGQGWKSVQADRAERMEDADNGESLQSNQNSDDDDADDKTADENGSNPRLPTNRQRKRREEGDAAAAPIAGPSKKRKAKGQPSVKRQEAAARYRPKRQLHDFVKLMDKNLKLASTGAPDRKTAKSYHGKKLFKENRTACDMVDVLWACCRTEPTPELVQELKGLADRRLLRPKEQPSPRFVDTLNAIAAKYDIRDRPHHNFSNEDEGEPTGGDESESEDDTEFDQQELEEFENQYADRMDLPKAIRFAKHNIPNYICHFCMARQSDYDRLLPNYTSLLAESSRFTTGRFSAVGEPIASTNMVNALVQTRLTCQPDLANYQLYSLNCKRINELRKLEREELPVNARSSKNLTT